MRRIDEIHIGHFTGGSRKIRDELRLEGGKINRKRVQRLMRHRGVLVVFAQHYHHRLPPDHAVYPYLLRGPSIDLTYIRLADGFVYPTAIEVLDRALRRYGTPKIFNSDQGVQFTSPAFLQPDRTG